MKRIRIQIRLTMDNQIQRSQLNTYINKKKERKDKSTQYVKIITLYMNCKIQITEHDVNCV